VNGADLMSMNMHTISRHLSCFVRQQLAPTLRSTFTTERFSSWWTSTFHSYPPCPTATQCMLVRRRLSRSRENNVSVGKVIRRRGTCDAREAWRSQFERQRQVFQRKFVTFWTLEIDNCKLDPRALWRTVQSLIRSTLQPTGNSFTTDDFTSYTRKKISAIRDKTAAALPPDIQSRSSPYLSSSLPATPAEIKSILCMQMSN
jgi:hypothetical protein